jgi:hypothetical protein
MLDNTSSLSITARRDFVKSAAVATVSAATVLGGAPLILGASKAKPKYAIVGKGEHTYECIHDWGASSLPAGHTYGNASHGVAVGKDGLVYITHNRGKPGSIFVFDSKGKFVRAFGDFHAVKGESSGHGIDIREENGEEFLYLCASNSSMGFIKCNLSGEIVSRIDKKSFIKDSGGVYKANSRYRLTNTCFTPDGGFIIGDGYGSGYMMQYDKGGKFIRAIGGNSEPGGRFRTPHGQWLDDRDGTPKLVVADRANHRLQWFDMKGKHLKTLPGFHLPADIDIKGDVLMVPDLHCQITLLDKENKVITHLGEDAEWRKMASTRSNGMRGKRPQWKPGKFIHPHDAAFDHDGNIICAEYVATGRITMLRKVAAV